MSEREGDLGLTSLSRAEEEEREEEKQVHEKREREREVKCPPYLFYTYKFFLSLYTDIHLSFYNSLHLSFHPFILNVELHILDFIRSP